MEKQITSENIKKIKSQLPKRGVYVIISGMVNGAYTPLTIKAMMNQRRTMNPGVFQEAKRLVEIMNPTPNTNTNETNE